MSSINACQVSLDLVLPLGRQGTSHVQIKRHAVFLKKNCMHIYSTRQESKRVCRSRGKVGKSVLGSAEAPILERDDPVAPKALAGPLNPAPAAPLPVAVLEIILAGSNFEEQKGGVQTFMQDEEALLGCDLAIVFLPPSCLLQASSYS